MKVSTYSLVLIFLLLLSLLSSCSNQLKLPGNYDIQLFPEKSSSTEITNLKITYVIPQSISSSKGINGLSFMNRQWGRDTKQEKIIVSFDNKILKVERRTDNGVAGSGRIYYIGIIKTNQLNNTLITLQSESMSTYQDGLILPFPLPEFDLQSYLTSATIEYNFELNSEFPADSVRANFDRILTKSSNNDYQLNLNNASAFLSIKVHPYRKGSKVLIDSRLFGMKHTNSIIDISKSIFELENYIKDVVNS